MQTATLPTVICIHGEGGGGWQWSVWARLLHVAGFPVLAADLQPVTAGVAHTSFTDYCDQVQAWAGAGPAEQRPVLVGVSLGGLLALAVSAQVRPRALIIINPLPPSGIVARPLQEQAYPAVVPWQSERCFEDTRRRLADADDATLRYAFRRWRDESGQVLNTANAGVSVSAARCPTLVLASTADEVVSVAASRALAVRLGADFQTLPGASHLGPLLGRRTAQWSQHAVDWLYGRVYDGAHGGRR